MIWEFKTEMQVVDKNIFKYSYTHQINVKEIHAFIIILNNELSIYFLYVLIAY